jgi:hypothetical protein
MILAASLAFIAEDPSFEAELVTLAESLNLAPADNVRLQAYAERKRAALLGLSRALGDSADEEELYRCLASAWLEQRFEWQRCNMVVNYQAVRTGEPDALTMAIASACTNVMERIERLLNADDRDRWSTFAVELITGTSADLASRWGDETISLSPLS